MSILITIVAVITAAATAKIMHLLFLSGKTISGATFFGRLVSRIEPARRAFVDGWKSQRRSYLCVAYPCMIVSMALVTQFLYWMMPTMSAAHSFFDMLRYCLLVFSVGISMSLGLSFVGMVLVYYLAALAGGWKKSLTARVKSGREKKPEEGKAPEPAAAETGAVRPPAEE